MILAPNRLFGPAGSLRARPFTDVRTLSEYRDQKAYRPIYVAAMDALTRFDGLWDRVRGIRVGLPPIYPEIQWPARAKALGYDASAHMRARAEFKRVEARYEALRAAWGHVYADLY